MTVKELRDILQNPERDGQDNFRVLACKIKGENPFEIAEICIFVPTESK